MRISPRADGYKGIWTFSGSLFADDEYCYYHYSGGLGTAFQQILPMAIYSKASNKTFFCYGGSPGDVSELLIMASYYDHATGMVPRPVELIDKLTDDAHDNPSMTIDAEGYIYIFANAHGTLRPAYVFRSCRPFDIDQFDLIETTNFSYAQPWCMPDGQIYLLHTRYSPEGKRILHSQKSVDGSEWTSAEPLAGIAQGHYQISWLHDHVLGTAYNYHPVNGGCRGRTNLYYMHTVDGGRSWITADGQHIHTPLTEPHSPCLVMDYESQHAQVFLKDLNYDADGLPIILYLTCRGDRSGPEDGPRIWHTAAFDGTQWHINDCFESDNCYDTGCLHVEDDGTWRIIAPTETGPQPYNTGGEVAMWTSIDRGSSWQKVDQLTHNSPYNHTYMRRPVHAHPDFYALWADGHARCFSQSRLYFCDRSGTVYQLPYDMNDDEERPIQLH